MSEIIERVARALYAALEASDNNPHHVYVGAYQEGYEINDETGEHTGRKTTTIDGSVDLTFVARAAIEAMREPTAAMLGAIMKDRRGDDPRRREGFTLTREWQAAIDEALR